MKVKWFIQSLKTPVGIIVAALQFFFSVKT